MTKKESSNLSESSGKSSETTNNVNLNQIKSKRKQKKSTTELSDELMKGSISALSQAITIIESSLSEHKKDAADILKRCLPQANKSVRIGITGVPGVGKSTFIEAFGNLLTESGKKGAVLAVDPSSTISKGSILGDKTRMETLVNNKNAFIRPSATGSSLGGVARKTRETIILCEAAGYDSILVETVGVGQSETAVHSMVDFFLLLKLPGAGDQLQGIKRGIMEMADCLVINKSDGDNMKSAKIAKAEFQRALHLYPNKPSNWNPKVFTCSALNQIGIDAIYTEIKEFVTTVQANGFFEINRINQNKFWLTQTIEDHLLSDFYENPKIEAELKKQMDQITQGKTTAFLAAEKILGLKN